MLKTAQLLRSFFPMLITIIAQSIQFLRLALSSRAALSAEVLFLRKQLAFYREHQVQPRQLTDARKPSTDFWTLSLKKIGAVHAKPPFGGPEHVLHYLASEGRQECILASS